jgi:hypothetical protein
MTHVTQESYELFNQRPWLEYVHEYARAIRVSPWALAGAVLARVSALTPPNVVACLTDTDFPMTLNLDVALVGGSGSGKSKCIDLSRRMIPTPDHWMTEIKPKTGESIPGIYLKRGPVIDGDGKPVKNEYEYTPKTDRALITLPEISALETSFKRPENTLLSTLLEGYSNETLGDDIKNRDDRLPKLPPYSYRLSAIIGMQPVKSGALLDNAGVGLAGRFLYLPTNESKSMVPGTRGVKPVGTFPFDARTLPAGNGFDAMKALVDYGGLWNMPDNGPDAREGYPLARITFPPEVVAIVDKTQYQGNIGELDEMTAHGIETIGRVAAILALMEGRTRATMDDWTLAERFTQVSRETIADCMERRERERINRNAERYAQDSTAREQAEQVRLENVKRRVLTQLDKHDPAREGMKGYEIRKLLGREGTLAYRAIESLYEDGSIDRLSSDKPTSSTLWSLLVQ